MKQISAVQWLVEQMLVNNYINKKQYENCKSWLLDEAKQLEKKQIIDANIAGMEFIPVDPNKYNQDAEQYYNEKYETKR